MKQTLMGIGAVARELGMNVRTLRYQLCYGVLQTVNADLARAPNGSRLFESPDIARIRGILDKLKTGVS